MINIEELQEIKKRLPQGALTKISKKAGVSYFTVIKFFNAKSKNEAVLQAVISEYKEHLNSVSTLKELIKG